MKTIIRNLHPVNGDLFRDIIWVSKDDPEELPVHIAHEVHTPHCGWKEHCAFPTCTKACDTTCRLAQEFLDEIK